MLDDRQIRANEPVKASANALFNLGSALLAAATARFYFAAAFDPDSVLWLILAGFLPYLGWLVLGLISEES